MLFATTLVLLSVTSGTSATAPARVPLASTYDEAACATQEPLLQPPEETGARCSEPAPVAHTIPHAIMDCNDPLVSWWVQEMIGSCDMPKPAPPNSAGPTVVRAARDALTARACDGIHCSNEAPPLRPASRTLDSQHPGVCSTLPLHHLLIGTPLAAHAECAPGQADLRRLERPPRTA